MVSWLVYLGVSHPFGPHDQIFIAIKHLLVQFIGILLQYLSP
jgi:hypothetical protein